MGVPKRKLSQSRIGKRRSHWGLKVPSFVECPRCKTKILPHRVCPLCEHYKGVEYRMLRPEKEAKPKVKG
ncbi:MAG: 50S ribosomal protein L32 [Planctomycetota bacterium]|nr:50S ribosomal protein L32 [Planctomycetota bacterium]